MPSALTARRPFSLFRSSGLWQDAWQLAERLPWQKWVDPPPPVSPTPPRPACIQQRESKPQATLAERKAQAPAPKPATAVSARELWPIKGFQWAEAPVRLHGVVLRETYADQHQEGGALLSTEDFADPPAVPRAYRRRTAIEERHRQLKCFHDLTDFHSRSFNAVAAPVVFLLLSYTLRQWQLWTLPQEQLAGRHPDFIQQRLNLDHQFVAIYHEHAYVQLPLVSFTHEVLELAPAARERALRQIRRLEQSFLTPVENLRPHHRSP